MSTSFLHNTGWPINKIDFNQAGELVVVGGGGQGHNGFKNMIALYRVDEEAQKLTEITSLGLSTEEDAPTSLAVHNEEPLIACGINVSREKIKEGENKNTRLFDYSDQNIKLVNAVQTSGSKDINDWQKAAKFSSDGRFLATGSTDGRLAILRVPSLTPSSPPTTLADEINDLDISPSSIHLAVVTPKILYLYALTNGSEIQRIENPLFNKAPCEFRGVLFGRDKTAEKLFTVVNPKGKNKGFVVRWAVNGLKRERHCSVSSKPIVSFAISSDGAKLAHASSDFVIGITDALSLRPLLTIPHVHNFAITTIAFSPLTPHLVTASADASIKVITLPAKYPRDNSVLWAMLIVLLAILVLFVNTLGNNTGATLV